VILDFRRFLLCVLTLSSFAAFSQNVVSTYCGSGSTGFNNGAVSTATFNKPFGMCIDKLGNLYVADWGNNCIRKVNTKTGTVSTYAGTGTAGWKDGASANAQFNSPADLCVDDSGNVYVSDFLNHRIRKISSTGIVSTVAGTGTAGYINGAASVSRFNYPRGICRDKAGNLYIGDSWNHRIRKITKTGTVSSYAGGGTAFGVGSTGSLVNANDTTARFFTPSGLGIDELGNVYVADAYNHRIRKISTTQAVTTVAGNGATGVGNGGFKDGSSAVALLDTPTEVYVDTVFKKIYIGDTFNNRVRKMDITSGSVKTFAGSGAAGFVNTTDTLSTFNYTRGLVLDSSRTKLYVIDYNNHAIRLVSPKITSGMAEISLYDDVLLFPNPSQGNFRVHSPTLKVEKIRLTDLLGNDITKTFPNNFDSYIDLSKGTYLVIIYFKDGVVTRKIIVQ